MNASLCIFGMGWAAVLFCVLVSLPIRDLYFENFLIALFAVATVALWRKPNFPRCAAGLATSWMGPLLLASWQVVYLLLLKPGLNAPSMQENPSWESIRTAANILIAQPFLAGCVSGLFFLWVMRGYGLVGLAALAATVWPRPLHFGRLQSSSLDVTLQEQMADYPSRQWWHLPLYMILFAHWLPGLILLWYTRQAMQLFH